MRICRRRWIVFAALGMAIVAGLGQRPWAAGGARRPNILLAIADDWSWPHAGAYGDRVIETPTFDRVAQQGVLFQQAYVAAP